MFNEHETQAVISRAGVPSVILPGESHIEQDGSGYGAETLESGLWTCGQERLQRPGCPRDMMPLRRMKSSGDEATWLREGCSLQPRGRSRRWKAGGLRGPSWGCQLCG